MIRPIIKAATIAIAAIIATSSVHADERPRLRADITVKNEIATIGDFFKNAGHLALTPLFRAPDLGQSGSVTASFVLERAMASGLANPDRNGLSDVIVRRGSLVVTPDMLSDMLREALAERIGITDFASLDLQLASQLPTEHADPAAAVPLHIEQLSYSARSGRFDARFAIRQGQRDKMISVAGTAVETLEVVTLTRRLIRGDIVKRQDLATQRIARNNLRESNIIDAGDVVGLVARRNQRPGRILASRDFQPPLLVKRREKVIIVYRVPGMSLSVQGEAIQDGAKGDTITVLNAQSHRRIEATVSGPGRVTVVNGTSQVASLKEALK